MPSRKGALPHQTVCELVRCGAIRGSDESMAQPASIDVALSDEVYRVRSVFRPRKGESIRDAMKCVCPESYDWRNPLELETTYLARLNEELELPSSIYGYANPKSSTGRNDLHVRLLADGINEFDSVGEKGYRGSLWCLITPRSFRPILHAGDSLLQIRFFNEDTRFSEDYELEIAYRYQPLMYSSDGQAISLNQALTTDHNGALVLTVNLEADMVGFRCEKSQEVLDWSKKGHYEPADFFEPICRPKKSSMILRKGDFYILFTNEFFKVPPEYAVEMSPIDIRSGDFRAHYAGYFDPGWGHGPDGSLKGAPAVMEVRSFEDNIMIRHGDPFCKMTFERMADVPDVLYGMNSNYLRQVGPRLSKHFKEFKP